MRWLLFALLAGCASAPPVSPPSDVYRRAAECNAALRRLEDEHRGAQSSLRSCTFELDAMRAGADVRATRRRMTRSEAERFNGLPYALVIDGVRCWPDGPEWMLCEGAARDCQQATP